MSLEALCGSLTMVACTSASAGGGGAGTVTSVSAGGGLDASTNPITDTGDIFIADTSVSAGDYTLPTLSINSRGQITAAANGVAGAGTVTSVSAGTGLTASTNPITTTGQLSITATGVSAGRYTFSQIDVNAQGQITSAANGAAGSGTVTSAGAVGLNGITVAGSPITTAGAFTLGLLDITPRNVTASGAISGTTGLFTGKVSAAAGINTTTVSAASIGLTGDITTDRVLASAATLTGKLTGAAAAFSGLVSADSGIKTTTVSAASIGVTGDINAATGRVLASAATFTGLLTGNTASFSGMVSANAALRATTVSASGVIGGSNLSGTNTGDQTIIHSPGITMDGGGSSLTTGVKGDIYIPYTGTIASVTILADQVGDIVVDIWKDTYANYPPTDADSITAAAPPTIVSANKSQDNTLTGWSVVVTAGSTLRFNVDSVTNITRATLVLGMTGAQ